MNVTRRQLLARGILASLSLGLRSVVSGIPPLALLDPKRALANDGPLLRASTSDRTPQFLVLSTSSRGDPLNCNVPGTYGVAGMAHPPQASMAPTNLTLGSNVYQAAAPWATLGSRLSQTCFFHHATETFNHPDANLVQRLNGTVSQNEMLIGSVAGSLASALGTVQTAPVAVGPETVFFQGRQQPNLSPLGVKSILSSPSLISTLMSKSLIAQRDKDLSSLNSLAKASSGSAQADFLDRYALSQTQAREASTNAASVISMLQSVADNGQVSQLIAAMALVRMKLTPAVLVHLNFGDDNHNDTNLVYEAAQQVAALQALTGTFLANVAASDNITFASLNVFGRDNGFVNTSGQVKGRDHNGLHHAMVMVGPNVRSSVIGGITAVPFGGGNMQSRALAAAIDPATGNASASGSVTAAASLASAGATLGAALGIDPSVLATTIPGGQIIASALA